MRWVHLTIIIVFAAATLIFGLQNFKSVTVSFLGLSIGAPLVIVIFVVYLLGAVTGGSLLALLRRSYTGSRLRPVASREMRSGQSATASSWGGWNAKPARKSRASGISFRIDRPPADTRTGAVFRH